MDFVINLIVNERAEQSFKSFGKFEQANKRLQSVTFNQWLWNQSQDANTEDRAIQHCGIEAWTNSGFCQVVPIWYHTKQLDKSELELWLKASSVSSAVFEKSMRMWLVAVDANKVTV